MRTLTAYNNNIIIMLIILDGYDYRTFSWGRKLLSY